jgi:hypothetical protein
MWLLQHLPVGDGRRQCKRCRAKYTSKRTQYRLDESALWEIARLFWLMVPAARGANKLGINRRTIQVHYGRMREHIAKGNLAWMNYRENKGMTDRRWWVAM